jgi:uncharacterized protein YdaL
MHMQIELIHPGTGSRPILALLRRFTLSVLLIASFAAVSPGQSPPAKRILILFEGSDVPSNLGRGDARELAMLLGHFNVSYQLKGMDTYAAGDINAFDMTFFIGYSKRYDPPERFIRDIYTTRRQVVWMNTGMERFSRQFDLEQRFGIKFITFDTTSNFDIVRAGKRTFTKGEPNLNIMATVPGHDAEVVSTAYSEGTRREAPYMIRCDNLLYIADSPFASATETDRYIYFADMLHDLLGEQHEEIHRALLRIEDVDVFESPARLRDIADLLASKHIPFLVGIIPFFVDPGNLRVSLSDKPEFVDAIHYMVARGATIVMHGVTHQYEGVTAIDYEFWDGSMDRKIRNDSRENVERKMKAGLEECWKNAIYPLVWETPHYTASQLDYTVFPEFFSTCMEQRLVIDNSEYSMYFPFIIEHDLFGQRIIPENLGYIPLNDTQEVEEKAVQDLLKGAEAQLAVRDGFASAFIHPFIDLKYIEEYVDGVLDLGYTFMNVKNEPNLVRLNDKVIVTGDETFNLTLQDQYIRETWLRADGKTDHWEISPDRVHGPISKNIQVPPGQIYLAEPSEYRETELTFMEKLQSNAKVMWNGIFESEKSFGEPRVGLLWDPALTGSEQNDQASYAAAFGSVGIGVDTLAGDTVGELGAYNLLIVPYHSVDHLSNRDYDRIVDFVDNGGNVITDGKNGLAEELGIKFATSSLKIEKMRDRLYPEDALILPSTEIMTRFEVDRNDEVFCTDDKTEAPVVLGRTYGRGRFLFLGMRFDPNSTGGYSRFPYLLEYVRNFFRLQPVLRRENLEVYFDDGYRHNNSIEDLVKHWVEAGIRVVHVVGWHQYPTWTYNYDRLIRLCHSNGILVYAWLDPPQVSEKFWTEHPEWQEQNYKGEAIRPSWRYPMALTSPACLAAVKGIFKVFLEKYDWDGVNLAELYFDAGNGPKDPRLLTPMHSSAREEFRRLSGFDPALLLDPVSGYYWKKNPGAWKLFENYRVDALVRFHEEFLKTIREVQVDKPDLDVVVTVMDNLGNPELRANLGVDVRRVVALQSGYRFTLQVEDPQSEWSKDPRRYKQMAERYRGVIGGDAGLMLDLNILQFRDEKKPPTLFPTLVQTGIESYEMVHSAASGADRVSIYSESSIRPQDLRMMSFAASARASLRKIPGGGWKLDTPFPVVMQLPREYSALRTGEGERITSDRGMFFIPAGNYTLYGETQSADPFSTAPTGGRILSISGELIHLENSNRSVTFSYNSDSRCAVSFSHRPFAMFVDGKEIEVNPLSGYRRFSVLLPGGTHTVIAVLETTVSYGVDITSFWSSWLIVAFGMTSGAALLTFYTVVRVSRPPEPKA